MTRRNWLLCLLSLTSLLVACDGSSPDAPFDPGIEVDRTLASLSDDEATAYCAAADDFRQVHISDAEMQRATCTLFAVVFSADSAACESSVTACLAAPGSTSVECLPENAGRADCSVSIADVNECTEASIRAMAAVLPELTCARAGDPTIFTTFATLEPPVCRTIREACPDLATSE